jgi:YggT family protein
MRLLVLTFINLAFDVFYLLLVVRAFLTYLPHNKYHPLIKPAYDMTEPALSVIRRGLPPKQIGFDSSPFIAIILLYLIQQALLKLLTIL